MTESGNGRLVPDAPAHERTQRGSDAVASNLERLAERLAEHLDGAADAVRRLAKELEIQLAVSAPQTT